MISQYTKYFTKEDLNLQSKKKKKLQILIRFNIYSKHELLSYSIYN